MPRLPDSLVRIAATGSNPSTKTALAQERSVLLSADRQSPERDLLLTVAAHALQSQAGYVPEQTHDDLIAPPEKSAKVPCSLSAQYHLMLMLNGLHDNLLPMWFEKLEQHQQTIPHEMIPTLLNYGARKRKLAPIIRQALGERGRWIVEQSDNRRWKWFTSEGKSQKQSYDNRFTLKTRLLQQMRQDNLQQAIESVMAQWHELDSLSLIAIMSAIEDKAHAEDVPFLMQCLQDDALREIAIKILFQIEDSDNLGIAGQNIKKLIVLKQVNNPEDWVIDFASAVTFEGHPEQLSLEDQNEISILMGYQFSPEAILMMLPLAYWYQAYDVTAEILITAAGNSSRPEVFYRIWERLAVDTEDTEFLYQLMLNVEHYTTPKLMKHLSQEQLMRLAVMRLNKSPIFSVDHAVINILKVIRTVWTDDLTASFLTCLENAFRGIPRPMLDKQMRNELLQYAEWIPLSAYSYFESILHMNQRGDLSEAETEEINGIMSIIKFRDEIINAIHLGTPH